VLISFVVHVIQYVANFELQILKVGRFSIGWFMLAARLVKAHLEFFVWPHEVNTNTNVIYLITDVMYDVYKKMYVEMELLEGETFRVFVDMAIHGYMYIHVWISDLGHAVNASTDV